MHFYNLTHFPQVVRDESQNGPLIVFIKDIEKSLVGGDSYTRLKVNLEATPPGVLIIGSHTQIDSRKEKVYFVLQLSYAQFDS